MKTRAALLASFLSTGLELSPYESSTLNNDVVPDRCGVRANPERETVEIDANRRNLADMGES